MPIRQITLFDKGSAQFQAYVNMSITSKDRMRMEDGSYKHALYYLSMFGPRGSVTSINAIFAGLANNSTIRDIAIDDIGNVALAHRLAGLSGFSPGWSCTFAEFGTNRAIHALVESKALSLWDPSLAVKTKRNNGSAGNKKLKEVASKDGELSDKLVGALERHPVFFLMVPPGQDAQQLHLAYLDKRCPFPLIDEWAQFLWDRALENNEISELDVWQYTSEGTEPMIASAFWCFPNIPKMIQELSLYIKEGCRETIAA